MTYLDALDPVAERIGAVNTIVNDEGHLVGHNTDWVGAMRALGEVCGLARARVLLVGAGGAGRAIAFGLRERGAFVTIANRDYGKARALAAETGAGASTLEETSKAGDYDVIVNATTLGQSDVGPTESAIPEKALRPGQVVMDIVYKPVHTPLLEFAARAGATPVHGGRMLLHQAAAQFELYTGSAAPLHIMDEALRKAIAVPTV
jgi:shikimate dehydrogenase